MGKTYETIEPVVQRWLEEQKLFFVATAPLSAEGLVNCSPKGMDSFRVLGPTTVAYLDLTGSGIETVAHLRENGRIVLTFCALTGAPKIVRLHGRGKVLTQGDPDFPALAGRFPDLPGVRSIIRVDVVRVSDSCGYSVPRYDFVEERDTLARWSEKKDAATLETYRRTRNARSLDGLPGWDGLEGDR